MRKLLFLCALGLYAAGISYADEIYFFPANKGILSGGKALERWDLRAVTFNGAIEESDSSAVDWDISGTGIMSRYTDTLYGRLSYSFESVFVTADAEGENRKSEYLKSVNLLGLGVNFNFSIVSGWGIYAGYHTWGSAGSIEASSLRSSSLLSTEEDLQESGPSAGFCGSISVGGIEINPGAGIVMLENADVLGAGVDIVIKRLSLVLGIESQTITKKASGASNNMIMFNLGMRKDW